MMFNNKDLTGVLLVSPEPPALSASVFGWMLIRKWQQTIDRSTSSSASFFFMFNAARLKTKEEKMGKDPPHQP